MSKEAEAFAKLKGFEASYKHLEKHPEIITEKIHDQILAEAFTAQLKGEEEKAKNYVIQSLTLQYCGQLGGNGTKVFFEKWVEYIYLKKKKRITYKCLNHWF